MDKNIFDIIEEVSMESGFEKDTIFHRLYYWYKSLTKVDDTLFGLVDLDNDMYKAKQLFNDLGIKSNIKVDSIKCEYDMETLQSISTIIAKYKKNCSVSKMTLMADSVAQITGYNKKSALVYLVVVALCILGLFKEVTPDDIVDLFTKDFDRKSFNDSVDKIIKLLKNKKSVNISGSENVNRYIDGIKKLQKSYGNPFECTFSRMYFTAKNVQLMTDHKSNKHLLQDKNIMFFVGRIILCMHKLEDLHDAYREFLLSMMKSIREL